MFHTCIIFVEFSISYFPLQRVTARDSWMSIVLDFEPWIMLLFCGFFLLPCLRAPSRGEPGFLAGPALASAVGCAFMIQLLLFQSCTRMSHMFHLQNGHRPKFENDVQIFTSHLPMMNLQDQVTLTNWPASKKITTTLIKAVGIT